jgi:hypothetical protein
VSFVVSSLISFFNVLLFSLYKSVSSLVKFIPKGFFYLFVFLWYWGLNSGLSPWAIPPAHFISEIGSYRTIFAPGWL